jgi:photosystem II stability/assembly factor-like uncharacterized protein
MIFRIFLIYLLLASPLYAQWTNLNSPVNVNLYGISFANADTGIVVGGALNQSVFLRTTDAGQSWSSQSFTATQWMYAVRYIGNGIFFMAGYNGIIYQSTDFGITWSPKPTNTNQWLYAIDFISQEIGSAVGLNGTIIRTTNSGNNWSALSSPTSNTLLDLHFADSLYGYAVGASGTILKTSDGGSQWITCTSGTDQTLTGVFAISSDTVFACGFSGTILYSTNAGFTWNMIDAGITNDLHQIHFTPQQAGFITGDQVVLQTLNNGMQWQLMNPPSAEVLFNVESTSTGAVYLAGAEGVIFKSDFYTELPSFNAEDILVYPNPVDEILNVLSQNQTILELQILDMSGKELININSYSNHFSVPVAHLSTGVYLLKMKNTNGTQQMKFIKN